MSSKKKRIYHPLRSRRGGREEGLNLISEREIKRSAENIEILCSLCVSARRNQKKLVGGGLKLVSWSWVEKASS